MEDTLESTLGSLNIGATPDVPKELSKVMSEEAPQPSDFIEEPSRLKAVSAAARENLLGAVPAYVIDGVHSLTFDRDSSFNIEDKYDDMIKFTSRESINEFGEDVIRDFYKNKMKFGYEIGKPHSQNVEGNVITLNYNGNIIATKTVIRINVVVENDSCKIVLPDNLKNFPS